MKENVYYEILTDTIFTYDYSKSCDFAFGLNSKIRHGNTIVFKDTLKMFIENGAVIKLGKL